MTRVWAGLVVSRVCELIETIVETGAEADRILGGWTEPIVPVTEPLSAALSLVGINLAREEDRALAALSRYGTAREEIGWGLVGRTPSGHAALGLGSGRTIETVGGVLALVRDPGAGRYSDVREVPGLAYLREA